MLFAAATHTAKAGTSIIGTVLHPIFVLVGYVLAFFYGLIPNYAVAIALLTIVVMIVVFPLTRASARSMMRMQLLAPEMKRVQTRYKPKPGMPAAERQELRQKMNEEVMALYRENGVNPTGGCLPMFLQFPILIVLYDVVRGLSKTTNIFNAAGKVVGIKATPQNIPKTSRMYHDLVAAKGQMHVFGINLADSVRTHQPHLVNVIPYALLVLIAVGLQYVSIWQVTTRNPAGRCGRLLHSFQLVPCRPAGVDVQTRPDDRESHQRAHGTQESRGHRGQTARLVERGRPARTQCLPRGLRRQGIPREDEGSGCRGPPA
jgi:YidC/Oxa1 family membrane protein insertase